MILSDSDIKSLIELANKASRAVEKIYDADATIVEYKDDQSPLTQADIVSHEIITTGLSELFPTIPIVSEEGDMQINVEAIKNTTYWLVDPIDGTQDFVNRTGEFCVAIGLIDNNAPTFGIIAAPTRHTVYYGGPVLGSYKKVDNSDPVAIHARALRPHAVAVSRSHINPATEAFIREYLPDAIRQPLGSMLKQAAIAEGTLDVYPCIGQPLRFWDLAAGSAIAVGAGATISFPHQNNLDWHATEDFKVGDFILSASSSKFPPNI